MNGLRAGVVAAAGAGYEGLARPLLFRLSAQDSHRHTLHLLAALDRSPALCAALAGLRGLATERRPLDVGGVRLPGRLILAAGLVKGTGFATEAEALAAVRGGANIIPGWRSMARLAGPVEFGSFTRHPRPGNPGTVLWRDVSTRSLQNRVGLKNPGAVAAAAFLARQAPALTRPFGLNVAVSPGVSDPAQAEAEVREALAAFLAQGVLPDWFTLNLSCPNTDDDPRGRQTAATAAGVCGAAVGAIRAAGRAIPLWVKVGPDLAPEQYRILMGVFGEVGVRAVVATNTLPQPAPGGGGTTAGVSGGRLHTQALGAARQLLRARADLGLTVDVVGCGGVLDGPTYRAYLTAGVRAVQYWSALIYRGPLAAAILEREVLKRDAGFSRAGRPRLARN